jgi:hypothetical protein
VFANHYTMKYALFTTLMLSACGASSGSFVVVGNTTAQNAGAARIAAFYSDSCSPTTGCPAPSQTEQPSSDDGKITGRITDRSHHQDTVYHTPLDNVTVVVTSPTWLGNATALNLQRNTHYHSRARPPARVGPESCVAEVQPTIIVQEVLRPWYGFVWLPSRYLSSKQHALPRWSACAEQANRCE